MGAARTRTKEPRCGERERHVWRTGPGRTTHRASSPSWGEERTVCTSVAGAQPYAGGGGAQRISAGARLPSLTTPTSKRQTGRDSLILCPENPVQFAGSSRAASRREPRAAADQPSPPLLFRQERAASGARAGPRGQRRAGGAPNASPRKRRRASPRKTQKRQPSTSTSPSTSSTSGSSSSQEEQQLKGARRRASSQVLSWSMIIV